MKITIEEVNNNIYRVLIEDDKNNAANYPEVESFEVAGVVSEAIFNNKLAKVLRKEKK